MTSSDRNLRPAGNRTGPEPELTEPTMVPRVEPIGTPESFKSRAYAALKDAIVSMDVYRSRADIRLDERRLALDFGISRTPVREAMAQLEREGFVRSVPRRGIYVVRKTKREVIEMITAWAALESMAARLITENADADGDRLAAPDVHQVRERRVARQARRIFRGEHRVPPGHHSHEPQQRARFDLAENLFTHMRMIRRKTIGEKDRADRSIRDHMTSSKRSKRATPSAPRTWCATTRSASPSTWRNTPIIWTEQEGFREDCHG